MISSLQQSAKAAVLLQQAANAAFNRTPGLFRTEQPLQQPEIRVDRQVTVRYLDESFDGGTHDSELRRKRENESRTLPLPALIGNLQRDEPASAKQIVEGKIYCADNFLFRLIVGKGDPHGCYLSSRTRLMRVPTVFTIFLLALVTPPVWGQAMPYPNESVHPIYERLLRSIQQIPIFDDHSHPGYADDLDVDAMASPPGSTPLRLRADNPELVAASRALFGYPYADFAPQHQKWLVDRKRELKAKEGTQYFDRILDDLNIRTVVANRVAMPPYLDRHRFLWAFFVDSFLFPFDNSAIMARNADQRVYMPLQEKLLRRELEQASLQQLPPTLDGYLKFISRVLDLNRANHAVSIKFEAAYFRSLKFGDPPESQAAAIYRRYKAGGTPPDADYTTFQDFIFRYLLHEAGRLNLAVQIHTSVGVGDFFSLANGNVLNLENVLRDPRYDSVRFVLLHGGFPYEHQAIWLTARKNVFLDSSLVEFYLYPSELKNVLKYWLSIYPDKTVFGSDAFPFSDALGAEEGYWLAVHSAREALAAALAELVGEHAFTEREALKIAHGYLHDNAAALYQLAPAK